MFTTKGLASESLLVHDRPAVRRHRRRPCLGSDRPVSRVRQRCHHRRPECRAGRVGVAARSHTYLSGGPSGYHLALKTTVWIECGREVISTDEEPATKEYCPPRGVGRDHLAATLDPDGGLQG